MKKFVWIYEPLIARDHPGYGFNEGIVRLQLACGSKYGALDSHLTARTERLVPICHSMGNCMSM
jgi:hypothetical protein